MVIHNSTPSNNTTFDSQHDQIREIIYLIRRLMQAGSLYTKELNKVLLPFSCSLQRHL